MKNSILLSALLLLVISCKDNYQEIAVVQEDPTNNYVRVAKVEKAASLPPIETMGRVASATQKQLSFKIGGIVERILVEEGDRFEKGAVLARLNRQEINAQVQKAEAQVAKLKRDLNRINQLYKDAAATLENVQDLTTALEVAEADLKVAKFNAQYAVITAPEAGKVLQKRMEAGELASPGSPVLLTATTRTSNVVKASVSDRQLVQLSVGDKATVQFDAYPNITFKGAITHIAEQAQRGSGTFEVEIEVATNGLRLNEGLIASVSFTTPAAETYLKIPIDALVEGEGQEVTFYTIAAGKAKQQQLTYHFIDKEAVYVLAVNSLAAGTQVVISAQSTLVDNQTLTIKSL